jgi:hypothetical protein
MALRQRQLGMIFAPQGLQDSVRRFKSVVGGRLCKQLSVVGGRLSVVRGNLRFANGTKTMAVWDDLCTAGAPGLSPRFNQLSVVGCANSCRWSVVSGQGGI